MLFEPLLAAAGAADVVLRDGATLRLRPPGPADADELVAFFDGLSERSLYLRFHGTRRVDRSLVVPYLTADWNDTGALVGLLGGRIVALASYARLRDRSTAEVAFAVADGQQHRGIGTILLEQLAARAAGAGISRFTAGVMAENRHALDVFAALGFELAREPEAGQIVLRSPVVSTLTPLAGAGKPQPGQRFPGCRPLRRAG